MKTEKKSLKARALAKKKRLETENVRNEKSLANAGYKGKVRKVSDNREKKNLNNSKQKDKRILKEFIMKELNWTNRSTLLKENYSYRKKKKLKTLFQKVKSDLVIKTELKKTKNKNFSWRQGVEIKNSEVWNGEKEIKKTERKG
jgi:hypothetical protein